MKVRIKPSAPKPSQTIPKWEPGPIDTMVAFGIACLMGKPRKGSGQRIEATPGTRHSTRGYASNQLGLAEPELVEPKPTNPGGLSGGPSGAVVTPPEAGDCTDIFDALRQPSPEFNLYIPGWRGPGAGRRRLTALSGSVLIHGAVVAAMMNSAPAETPKTPPQYHLEILHLQQTKPSETADKVVSAELWSALHPRSVQKPVRESTVRQVLTAQVSTPQLSFPQLSLPQLSLPQLSIPQPSKAQPSASPSSTETEQASVAQIARRQVSLGGSHRNPQAPQTLIVEGAPPELKLDQPIPLPLAFSWTLPPAPSKEEQVRLKGVPVPSPDKTKTPPVNVISLPDETQHAAEAVTIPRVNQSASPSSPEKESPGPGSAKAAAEEAARVNAAAEEAARVNAAAEEAARIRGAEEEAANVRAAAEEVARVRAAEETARVRAAAEEAARVRAAAEEAARVRAAAEEAARVRAAAEEAARVRAAAEEAARVRAAAEEAAKVRAAAEEAAKVRAAAEEAAKVRAAAEEAARVRVATEEAARVRVAAEEAGRVRAAAEEAARVRAAAEEAGRVRAAAEEAGRVRAAAEEAAKARADADSAAKGKAAGSPGGGVSPVQRASAQPNGDDPNLTRIDLPPDGKPRSAVLGESPEMRGRIVSTIYIRIGLRKNWTLEYWSQGNTAALDAPWAYTMFRPNFTLPADADALLVSGHLNTEGRLEQLAMLAPSKWAQADLLFHALEQWKFRPAAKDGAPVAVDILLVIPRQPEQ